MLFIWDLLIRGLPPQKQNTIDSPVMVDFPLGKSNITTKPGKSGDEWRIWGTSIWGTSIESRNRDIFYIVYIDML